MHKGENYMFNEMLEKYKAFKSKKSLSFAEWHCENDVSSVFCCL